MHCQLHGRIDHYPTMLKYSQLFYMIFVISTATPENDDMLLGILIDTAAVSVSCYTKYWNNVSVLRKVMVAVVHSNSNLGIRFLFQFI